MSGRPMTLCEIMEAEETPLDIDISEDMEREFSPQRKEQTMALGYEDQLNAAAIGSGGYVNQSSMDEARAAKSYAQNAVKPTGPVVRLHQSVDKLSQAVSFARETADALCGQVPDSNGNVMAQEAGTAVFPIMHDLATRIDRYASQLHEAMQRIHKSGSE